jgi:hypothetical protein
VIGHGQDDFQLLVRNLLGLKPDYDAASLTEFDPVEDNIEKNLPQSRRIC